LGQNLARPQRTAGGNIVEAVLACKRVFTLQIVSAGYGF